MSVPQVLMAVASYAMSSMAQSSADRKQRNLVNQMQQYQIGKSKESQAAIEKFLGRETPESRVAENANVKSELATSLKDSIGTAQAFEKPQNFAGKVSGGYSARAGSNAASVQDRIRAAIENLSTIGAPAKRDTNSALRFGQAAGDVGSANTAINNVGQAFQRDAANVRPDPFLTLASQVVSGINMANSAGAFSPKTTGTSFAIGQPGYNVPTVGTPGLGLKLSQNPYAFQLGTR